MMDKFDLFLAACQWARKNCDLQMKTFNCQKWKKKLQSGYRLKAQDKFALTHVWYGSMQLLECGLQAARVWCHFGGIEHKKDTVNLLIQGGVFSVATYCITDRNAFLELEPKTK